MSSTGKSSRRRTPPLPKYGRHMRRVRHLLTGVLRLCSQGLLDRSSRAIYEALPGELAQVATPSGAGWQAWVAVQ